MPAVPKPKHKRRIPTKKKRGEFSTATRKKILERDGYCCRECGGKPEHIHHVVLKGFGNIGRGVYTNGLTLCNGCHDYIHKHYDRLRWWQDRFRDIYGDRYWEDEWDETDGDLQRN